MRMIRPGFLSSAERLALEACVRSQRADHGVARRANAILLLDDGTSCQVIAEFLCLDDDTIRSWHKTYREGGWDALAADGWKGDQSRLTAPQNAGPMQTKAAGRSFEQLPAGDDAVFFDHLAHFVPDMDAAAKDLARAGFTLTPFTLQHTQHGPAGTGNRCIMLREGYLEILTPTGEATALAQQMNVAIARYTGTHLLAFATPDTARQAEALHAKGFRLQESVQLRRMVATEGGGEAELRFTVLRPEPGQMPEGRIQYLTHHTPDALWQDRYLTHDNGALGLVSAVVAVPDLAEAVARYSRFLAREPVASANGHAFTFALDRGSVTLANPSAAAALTGNAPCPALPCIIAYTLGVADLAATVAGWRESGLAIHPASGGGAAIDCAGTRIIAVPA